MFFGYNFFADSNSLDFATSDISITSLQLSNGIFDSMDLVNVISTSDGYFSPMIPTSWATTNVLQCDFDQTINAGNISELVSSLSQIEIRRAVVSRNLNSNGSYTDNYGEWITLMQINKVDDTIITSFTMYDTYNQNNVLYEYRFVPIDIDGNEGTANGQRVLSQFYGAYICDYNEIYNITAEYGLSNLQRVQKSVVYTPYGSKFPTVAYNALTNYLKGSTSAIILSNTTGKLDRYAQVQIIKNIGDFLTNGKAKIQKDFNGNINLVTILDAVEISPYKELGNGLSSFQYSFIEIGDITQDYLSKAGMLNKFELITD